MKWRKSGGIFGKCWWGQHTFTKKIELLSRQPNPGPILDCLKSHFVNPQEWDLKPCTYDDIAGAIDELRPTKSCGPDGISNLLLKNLKFEIIPAMTLIVNKSIENGVFPLAWKSGRVLPVHKKGSKLSLENYRPICLSSNLGKLLELIVGKQINSTLENILPDNAFGFRKGKGTESALVHLLDNARKFRSQGKIVALLGLDVSSAFDLLSHSIILKSFGAIGGGPRLLAWVLSFLSGCSQFVEVGSAKSVPWTSECGSGQGKRLSPPLFNVGSMTQCFWSLISIVTNFADDSMDLVYGDTAEECNDKLQTLVAEKLQ